MLAEGVLSCYKIMPSGRYTCLKKTINFGIGVGQSRQLNPMSSLVKNLKRIIHITIEVIYEDEESISVLNLTHAILLAIGTLEWKQ